jgi:hypothetical protein
VHDRPLDGDVEELNCTMPTKPFTEDTVIVEAVVDPALVVTPDGLALIEKSGTAMLYVTVVVCDSEPSAPLTVTV